MTDPIDQTQITSYDEVLPYASVEFADDYFAQTVSRRAFWNSLPADDPTQPVDKIGALREATLVLDVLHYQGVKYFERGPRAWPRYVGFGTVTDVFYLEQRLPLAVAQATAEQAYVIAWNLIHGNNIDGRLEAQAQGIYSVSRAGASENAESSMARRHRVCTRAMELLKPYLQKTANLETDFRTPRV